MERKFLTKNFLSTALTASLIFAISPTVMAAGLFGPPQTVSKEAGGFAGIDIPLAKGFRLNVEGQYSDRFSAGAAVSYTY